MANLSTVYEFILIGFPGLQQIFHVPVSIVMLLVYSISLTANILVIGLIIVKKQLHQPMYIIIANLALSDLLFDTITLPKIIAKYWFGAGSISFYGCFFQMFCAHYLGSLDSFIIMLMAVDRYVAICKPLRYHSIIGNRLVGFACYFFWILAAIIGLAIVLIAGLLPFCGPNLVKNCFCASPSVIILACVDVTIARRIGFIIGMIVHLLPLSVIIISYIIIIRVVHSSAGNENWQKAFYTCTTHMFVIGLYFIPRLFVYVTGQIPLILNADLNVLIFCLYTFIPHVASPIIYCLRTKEIRNICGQILKFTTKKGLIPH